MKGLLCSLLFLFTLRDHSGSRNVSVYLDINSYQSFNLVLQNDDVQRNVFLKFARIEVPSDIFINVCARGLCNPYDTCTVRNVMPFEEVPIEVTLFSGQNSGPFNAYLLAFDVGNPSVRDSVFFSGIVPIMEKLPNKVYCSNGVLYARGISELMVFDGSGKLLQKVAVENSTEIPIIQFGRGVFFIIVRDSNTSHLIKVVNLR